MRVAKFVSDSVSLSVVDIVVTYSFFGFEFYRRSYRLSRRPEDAFWRHVDGTVASMDDEILAYTEIINWRQYMIDRAEEILCREMET